jgi:hypothetical protein
MMSGTSSPQSRMEIAALRALVERLQERLEKVEAQLRKDAREEEKL